MYSLEKGFKLPDFPEHLDIEVTSRCNYRCLKCFQSFMEIEPVDIDPMLFKKIIDEGSEKGLKSVKLNYRGEPLLYEGLEILVDYASKKGIYVSFNTNGSLLTPKLMVRLAKAGLSGIDFSIDCTNREDYIKIYGIDRFDLVSRNLFMCLAIKQLYGFTYEVAITATKSKVNENEFPDFFKWYWGRYLDKIIITPFMDYLDNSEDWTPTGFKCDQPFKRMVIFADGRVFMCCGMIDEAKYIGNAWEDDLEVLWKGSKLEYVRRRILEGNIHMVDPCRRCPVNKLHIKNKEVKKNGKKEVS